MRSFIDRFFAKPTSVRKHLESDTWPAAVYAIGDIHGCYDELRRLEDAIYRDAEYLVGEKWLVCLGDYIDRGPRSAAVLDWLTRKPKEPFKKIPLVGNHEVMMLQYWARPRPQDDWLQFGGIETLHSYGIRSPRSSPYSPKAMRDILDSHIPSEHRELMETLPLTLSLPGVLYVHAGIRRGIPVNLQSESDLLWIREPFFDAPTNAPPLVVHGHTPAPEPVLTPNRICVDTGAFATGRLTAVRLSKDLQPKLISS